ncbi:MAG: hypothetical protein CL555_05930 [Algoriphagus sp.]|nr:hypothetical protein [Algoriphagus sp.]
MAKDSPEFTGLRAELLSLVGGMERFVSGFSQRTFSPERRASQSLEEAVEDITEATATIYESGGDSEAVAKWVEGYKKRWAAYQHAGARTMNWMITGPARFPVERNQKRLDTEHKRMGELIDYRHGVEEWIRRNARRAERAALIAADEGGHREREIGGVRIVENTTLERIQIIFPDKPSDDERAALKRRGLRWAPSAGAWQRKLTNNARHVASSLVRQFVGETA